MKPRVSLGSVLPWTGLGSLLLAACCGVAALVIGFTSNSMPQNSWEISGNAVRPSVLLSILATLANTLLRIAFAEGAAITWWLHSSQGISVGKLSALYQHAYSVQSLLRTFNFTRVTLAAGAMLLLLADGPFLQRASTIKQSTGSEIRDITVGVSPSPHVLGSTGVIMGDGEFVPSLYTSEFSQIVQQYISRDPITIPGLNYSDTISMDLIAPGWDIRCVNGSSPYRLRSFDEEVSAVNYPDLNLLPDIQIMFETNVTFLIKAGSDFSSAHGVNFSTSYKSTRGGNGTKSWQQCDLLEAIVRYPLSISDGIVKLQPINHTENRTQCLIQRETEWSGFSFGPSTMGGFSIALQSQFGTNASIKSMYYPHLVKVTSKNGIANQYISPDVTPDQLASHDIFWTDPSDSFFLMANELALRAAIRLTNQSTESFQDYTSYHDAANYQNYKRRDCYQPTCSQPEVTLPNLSSVNRTVAQEVRATMTSSSLVYHTDKGWLLGGFAIIILACVAVAPLYWGWWRLERAYTMDPLDTAKAFDAPVLREADAFAAPNAWARNILEMRVRYGRGVASNILLSEAQGTKTQGLRVGLDEVVDEHENLASEEGFLETSRSSNKRVPKFLKLE